MLAMLSYYVKKCLILLSIGAAFLLATILPLQAQEGGGNYLALIAEYTYGILQKVDTLPKSLADMVSPDTSNITANLQATLADLSQAFISSKTLQDSQFDMTKTTLFPSPDPRNPSLFNANDLTYATLLGSPVFKEDPRGKNVNPIKNYAMNVSAISVHHVPPSLNWNGNTESIKDYQQYYNSITAIQSYNGYILSKLYADNQTPFNTLQKSLLDQAGSTDWFAQVASESVGVVLRQILMFQSQSYLLFNKFLEVQKELLYTQAMNNSLLILANTSNEDMMVRKARAPVPGSE